MDHKYRLFFLRVWFVLFLVSGCGQERTVPPVTQGDVRGRVVDSNFTPVVGATASLNSGSEAQLDSDGNFLLRGSNGFHTLVVKMNGVTLVEQPVNVSGNEGVDIGTVQPKFYYIVSPTKGFKAQMHLHGHSNHNGDLRPASMQWHTAWASETQAADILWWTDHHHIFNQTSTVVADISLGSFDVLTQRVLSLGTGDNQVNSLDPVGSLSALTANLSTNGLRFEIKGSNEVVDYIPRSGRADGTIISSKWSSPISSGRILDVDLECGPTDDDRMIDVIVNLSWHKEIRPVQQQLIFRFRRDIQQKVYKLDSPDVVVAMVPVQEGLHTYSLNLLEAAALLSNGDDNTISNIRFRLSVMNDKETYATLRRFSFRSIYPDPTHQMNVMASLVDRYQKSYDVVGHVGIEFNNSSDQLLHLNGFLLTDLDDPTLLKPFSNPADWTSFVHGKGGLVSYNHPFGVDYERAPLLQADERSLLVKEASQYLFSKDVYGADILEAGYVFRGKVDLHDHLQLWDNLLGRGRVIFGNGASDSHGGDWSVNMSPNPFTTWVLSDSTESSALINTLKSGRSYFGNPFLWDGLLDFSVGDAVMGQVISVTEKTAPIRIQLVPWPDDMKVFLVQGLIKDDPVVNYLHKRTEIERGKTIIVDTSVSSFVRLEVYRRKDGSYFKEGIPIVFSNPVIILSPPTY